MPVIKGRDKEREGLGGKLRNDWMDSRRQQQQKALIPPYWDSEHNWYEHVDMEEWHRKKVNV